MPVCAGEKWPSQCQPRPFYSQSRQLPYSWHVVTMPANLCEKVSLVVEGLINHQILSEPGMAPGGQDVVKFNDLLCTTSQLFILTQETNQEGMQEETKAIFSEKENCSGFESA